MKFEIKALQVSIKEKEILKGINLKLEAGKVYALMGPNGSGKSTLAQTIMGHPRYEVTNGQISINEEDITENDPNERAQKGIFLSFQYPAEITGVTLSNFLKAAYNAVHEEKLSVIDFHKMLKQKMQELNIDPAFAKRYINTGFSGGEKKKAEILQLSVLNPKLAILDETDSGLDVDALKIVAQGVNKFKSKDNAVLLITHYNRILEYITPDVVFVMKEGKIIKEGGAQLAKEIEENGFDNL